MELWGWMSRVRVDYWHMGVHILNSICFLGKLDQFFFDHAHWWCLEVTLLLAYLAKLDRKWITIPEVHKKRIPDK